MLAPWVKEEMKDVNLSDKRLNERLTKVLAQLGARPTVSIPAACGGHAETVAAYRLFDNEKVDFESILEPHIEATWRRVADQDVALLVQDTTEIDLTRPAQQVDGAGPLDGNTRRGAFLHPLHAFTPDGTPLGTVSATVWTRDDEPLPPKQERQAQRKQTPIEQKESLRWLETLQHAGELAQASPDTQMVCIADSEADIYEVLAEAGSDPRQVDWIVRACQNRAVQGENDNDAANLLRDQALTREVLFTRTINIRGRDAKVACEDRARRQPRVSRGAEVEVRAVRLTLRPPHRPDRKLPEVTVHVVLVSEIDPPDDEPPVEWLLLTSLPIDNQEQVRQVIQYYCVRWMIEILFRTLKSGCRAEKRRFEHLDRFLPCLAVYLIVAWRTLYVCRLGREFPDIDCEAVFEPSEWKSVYQVVHRKPPPDKPPRLQEMVRLVAQLGGYINRKRDDEPGPQTVWLGLQRLHDIALCWQIFGPESQKHEQLV